VSAIAGRSILVTRPEERSRHLVRALAERGARPIAAPTISISPNRSASLAKALAELRDGRFTWIVLTSPATVAMLADRLTTPKDVRAMVAAIGNGTGSAFRRWAARDPDLVARSFTTVHLARSFHRGEGRVLCARADIASKELEEALSAKGWEAVRVDAYRTTFATSLPKEARDALGAGVVDAVTFTSASTVRGFVQAARVVRGDPKVVCIGPVTAREARAHGLPVHATAEPHTTEGLIAALERVFAASRPHHASG